MHLKWKANSLDFNTSGVEYMCFESLGYFLWATCLNDHGDEIQISRKFFNNLVDVAKFILFLSMCLNVCLFELLFLFLCLNVYMFEGLFLSI